MPLLVSLIPLLLKVFSLKVLQDIRSNYSLATNEYIILPLDEYFSGPSLYYSISPESPNMFLANSSLELGQITKLTNFETPNSIELLQSICQLDDNYCQKYLHASNKTLYCYNFNSENKSLTASKEFEGEIITYIIANIYSEQYYIVIYKGRNELKMKTASMIYNQENNTYGFITNHISINEPFSSLNPSSVYISNGLINNQFMVTGHTKGRWNMLLLESFNSSDVRLLGNVTISGSLHLGPMFCVTIDNSHYVYLPGEKIVAQILSFQDNVIVNNSIFIDMKNFQVSSMQPSHNFTSLLLGINCGFIIVSLDFERSFFHIFEGDCKLYVYSSLDHNYFLTIENENTYIGASEQNSIFTILGNKSLDIDMRHFSWTIYINSTGQEFLIISGNNSLYQKEIILNGAYMNFTSSDNETLYSLSIFNQQRTENMIVNFTVTKLEDFEKIFLVGHEETNLVLFYNLNGSLEINLYDYFLGSDLQLANCNIFCDTNEISAMVTTSNKNTSVCSFSEGIQNGGIEYESNCMKNFQISKQLSIENGNFVRGNYMYIYNSTGLISLKNNNTFYKPFEDYSIVKIISCGLGFFYILENNTKTYISYSNFTSWPLPKSIINVSSCLNPQCSNNYFACQNNNSITIYNLEFNKIPILNEFYHIIPNENITSEIIIDYIMINYSIAIVTNLKTFLLYNIDNSIYKTINFIYQMNLPEPVIEICADNFHYYIITNSNNMLVYSYTLKYEKQIYIGPYIGINAIDSLVFAYNNSYMNVFNASLLVGNAKVLTISIPQYTSISIENVLQNEISIFLIDSNNNVYENSLFLTCKIFNVDFFISNTASGLYYIYYNSTLSLNVTNNYNYYIVKNVNIILYVNGQSIYVNNNTVTYIQDNYMEVACGSDETIPLDEIFWGQNLKVNLTETIPEVTVNERFVEVQNSSHNMKYAFSAFMPVKDLNIYIAVNSCTIFIYDANVNNNISMTIADDNIKSCSCTDIGNLYNDNLTIVFVLGCQFKTFANIFYNSISMPENQLIFFNYYNYSLTQMEALFLDYFPSTFKEIVTNGGEFMIAAIDTYSDATVDSYFSNHLQFIRGNVTLTNIFLYDVNASVMEKYMVARYYFSDVDGVYDPNFNMYYFYLTEIYTGLVIVALDINWTSTVSIINYDNPVVSLVRCGSELYVSFLNSTMYKYNLISWGNAILDGIIYPYLSTFVVTPGSMSCSDFIYGKYLLFLMQNPDSYIDPETYLLVIDNTASALASTVKSFYMSNSYIGNYAYFYNQSTIVALTSTNLTQFYINEYVMNINPNGKCSSNKIIKLNLMAQGDWVVNRDAKFVLKIKENYSQGSVDFKEIPYWGWVLIVLGLAVLTIIAVKISKKFRRCKFSGKDEKREQLFKYEFIEGEIN
ncbi:hypothetical protein SteCoe_29204 [Stentor coeruleus]|uniref:Uncharacterized protein n=1 Tax=Stentor coeruleus TaxID=5963 RepID=A0A1R2B6J6_9CILI|nr:hypothetical protein SteCoe_29204 [Stentor coeruleus]